MSSLAELLGIQGNNVSSKLNNMRISYDDRSKLASMLGWTYKYGIYFNDDAEIRCASSGDMLYAAVEYAGINRSDIMRSHHINGKFNSRAGMYLRFKRDFLDDEEMELFAEAISDVSHKQCIFFSEFIDEAGNIVI